MISEQYIPQERFLYHATYKPLLKKIMTMGLDTRNARRGWDFSVPGYVYLAKDPETAASYAEEADEEQIPDSWIDNIIILKIDVSKLDKSKLFIDQNVKDEEYPEESLEYRGVIPWTAVAEIIKY